MKKTVCLLLLICAGCVKKPAQQHFKITVLGANTIGFGNIDYNILSNLRQDSLSFAEWQAILPVYRMPADTDMKDFLKPQPGKYAFKNDSLIFSADTAFKKHSIYFVRYYQLHDAGNVWDVIKGNWKRTAPQYTECTFTP